MRWLKYIMGVLGLLVTTVCFAVDTQASAVATPTTLERLTIVLDWFPNPNHAPLFVAQQQGFFAQQGLDVRLIGPANPADPPKLVAAKKADMAITYQPQLLLHVGTKLPLVRIATLINQPLNCVVVREDSPIKTIKDLKGKRIGYSTGGIDSVILQVMLKNNGLTFQDVSLISLNYNLTQALLTKAVDATVGMLRNFELTEMKLLKQPGRAFYPEQNGVPLYDELVLVVHPNSINDPRVRRFLLALQQGVSYLRAHPQETWQRFAELHPDLDNALNRSVWADTVQYFPEDPVKLDVNRYQQFAIFMQKEGLIGEIPPLDTYAVDLSLRQ